MNLSAGCLRFSQLTLIASALVLAGCGSTPKTVQSRAPVESNTQVSVVNIDDSPESLIKKARSAWENNHDAIQRNRYLLDAADLYLQENESTKAQAILLLLKEDGVAEENRLRLNFLIATLYNGDDAASDDELLSLLSPLATIGDLKRRQQALRATILERKHDWTGAAEAYAESLEPSVQSVEKIWALVNHATPSQRQQAQASSATLRPYLALYDLAATEGLSPAGLSRALVQFNQVYRGHPVSEYMPASVVAGAELRTEPPREVAVLLPLSGKLGATGTTIKEGLLSAYYDQASALRAGEQPVSLNFIDTQNKTADELLSAIHGYKWVIGPLLKENVEGIMHRIPAGTHLLALNRADAVAAGDNLQGLTGNTLTSDVPSLADITEQAGNALNLQPAATSQQAFFALAPEDEATQLADYIYQNGFKTPIVVSAQNSINQRMETAFTTRWQELNGNKAQGKQVKLTTVQFTDSNSLREGITQSLDVAQSHDRIKQIEYMVNEKLYNVPRNRRDVDAIIVFASPEQTELLNPMVEASLSPFNGQTVPVFATSRYIEYDDTKNQWRDLQNVRFLDMPWMLPQHQWQTLQSRSETLWPQRSTQMSRLFAFGVDAYNLLPHMPSMMALPQTQLSGLTGTLSINSQGDVVRTLPQAVISNEAVQMLSSGKAAAPGR